MERLIPLFERAGVRVVLNGHEHNFQHSRHNGIDYFITGAGSKLDRAAPNRFDDAHTVSWSNHAHFLLVTIEGMTMTARVIGEAREGDTDVTDVVRYTPSGEEISGPIALRL